MSGAISMSRDEVEIRTSVYQRPLKSQLRKDDWSGPPFNVWSHFTGAEAEY